MEHLEERDPLADDIEPADALPAEDEDQIHLDDLDPPSDLDPVEEPDPEQLPGEDRAW